jgi:hypothetical protein
VNRRQLLLRGALLAVLAPVVRAAGSPAVPAASRMLVVHDPAYRRSREFAAALQERGASVLPLEPDALALWHGPLRAACADPHTALRIAGLTTRTDFLVLRDLAREAGFAPLAAQDADADGPRRRATLIAWVLAPRAVA